MVILENVTVSSDNYYVINLLLRTDIDVLLLGSMISPGGFGLSDNSTFTIGEDGSYFYPGSDPLFAALDLFLNTSVTFNGLLSAPDSVGIASYYNGAQIAVTGTVQAATGIKMFAFGSTPGGVVLNSGTILATGLGNTLPAG